MAIGADAVPQIRIMNKIDRLDSMPAHLERDADGQAMAIWLSARTGEGLALIAACLRERFSGDLITRRISLGSAQGDVRAKLYRVADVLEDEQDEAGGWTMRVTGSREALRCLDASGAPEQYERLSPLASGAQTD